MDRTDGGEVLGQGRFLRLVRRNGWEFVERTKPVKAAFIAALTDDGRLILTKEYREPIRKTAVGFPAGLIGDTEGQESESLEAAVKRELLEEAGFEAQKVTLLTEGPTSAGQTEEVIAVVLAEGLRKVGAGGGIEGEHILIHEVPLAEVDAWLEARVREGCLIDPKVYTGLYFIHRRRERAGSGSP
jgi:ADP-ribose pyrophosphatase